MFLMLVEVPSTIQIDTLAIVKVSVAFIVLGGVLWGIRKMIKMVNRS